MRQLLLTVKIDDFSSPLPLNVWMVTHCWAGLAEDEFCWLVGLGRDRITPAATAMSDMTINIVMKRIGRGFLVRRELLCCGGLGMVELSSDVVVLDVVADCSKDCSIVFRPFLELFA